MNTIKNYNYITAATATSTTSTITTVITMKNQVTWAAPQRWWALKSPLGELLAGKQGRRLTQQDTGRTYDNTVHGDNETQDKHLSHALKTCNNMTPTQLLMIKPAQCGLCLTLLLKFSLNRKINIIHVYYDKNLTITGKCKCRPWRGCGARQWAWRNTNTSGTAPTFWGS